MRIEFQTCDRWSSRATSSSPGPGGSRHIYVNTKDMMSHSYTHTSRLVIRSPREARQTTRHSDSGARIATSLITFDEAGVPTATPDLSHV